jgi:cholesterol transport system auxiliary component
VRLLWPLMWVLAGCAITSKQKPIEFRYFSPEVKTAPAVNPAEAPELTLRLGRVTSSSNLRTPILYRESAIEVREYVSLRWTENPEDYARRSISRALFDSGRFSQGLSRSLPAVDVELVAFEEVRTPRRHAGRVQLRYQLTRELEVLAAGTITKERETKPGIEAAVLAIGAAMDQAAEELSRIVADRLKPANVSEAGP